jgi:hypothetical protein
MAPKPFGKPIPGSAPFPRLAKVSLVVLCGAPIAYYGLSSLSRSYRTLSVDAFFWPSAVVFGILFAFAWQKWFLRRVTPRGPEGPSWLARVGRFLLVILLAAPLALSCAFLYQPSLGVLNGVASTGSTSTAHAMVEVRGGVPVLRSPYWPPDFRVEGVPAGAPAGSLARLTLDRGLLGALWIRRIEIEEFR